ncbi:hypothetical protein Tco_0313408 [Tanacetum coccineum]
MSYEDIRPIFERVWDQNNAFVPKDSEIEKEKLEDDAKKKELRDSMDIVPRDDIDIDVKADRSSKNYKIFSEMLDGFDRQDVLDLHRLVQKSWRLFDLCGIHMLLMHTGIAIHMMIEKKYPLTQEMLSRMLSRRLEVDQESEMEYELLRFIVSCKGLLVYKRDPNLLVYTSISLSCLQDLAGINIMLVEKDYPMKRGLPMLMLINKLQVDQHSEMADELLRKIFILANKPRH